MRIQDLLLEAGTEGAITTAALGPANPTANLSPGPARGNKKYLGSPTTGSGTKAPPQPKPKMQKPTDNALDGDSVFGAPIKR
jgi:hypothetical protein